jgi:hypothetical protein
MLSLDCFSEDGVRRSDKLCCNYIYTYYKNFVTMVRILENRENPSEAPVSCCFMELICNCTCIYETLSAGS